MIDITCVQGSLLDVEAQVIVNAANSHGLMGGGVAGIIRRSAGSIVEDEARRQAPIPVGQAVLTSGGRTRFAAIIHAPTMPEPSMRIPVENVKLATRAALRLADEQGFVSLAIPGMGTGVGSVAPEESAQGMVEEIREFQPQSLRSVTLVDVDPVMVLAWQAVLSRPVVLEDEFCDVVKKARKGLSQSIAGAAETAQLRKDDWERLEQGIRAPSEHEVQAMAGVLALKAEALSAVSIGGWVPQPSPEWVSTLVVTVLGDIGGYEVKGYVLIDPQTKQAVFIDTAYNAEAMLAVLDAQHATLTGVCLTHGHMDHAGGLDRILSEWPVPVYLGEGDFPLLPWKPPKDTVVVPEDGRVIAAGDLQVECLATPGHTPGGICYRVQSQDRALCFVGDTLFAGSVGGSNPLSLYADHLASVRRRVLQLDPDTVLLPGHGPPTTVKEELVMNPFG